MKQFNALFNLSLALVLCLWTSELVAQKINIDILKGMNIRSIGPAGMSGRVTSIDVNLNHTDEIIIGTASGGVWRSTSGGTTWQPIFDEAPVQSVGAVKMQPNNPDVIWVGTGEGNPRNSHNSGIGVYKSIDGGKNWSFMGLKKTRNIHRIIIHRDNPDIVYIGATGVAWGDSEHRGVYKTTDGGATWNKILYVDRNVGVGDMVADPENPDKILVNMWEHGRKPYTFNSGGEKSGLYVTFDGGETWKKRTHEDGLPKGKLGRMGLAIAPSNPDRVYALVESESDYALFRSEDGGFKWKKLSSKGNIGNRPFYYAEIHVDPQDENTLYSLHSTLTHSIDGGKNWESFASWEIHLDHHAFWINPNDPSHIIDGNDGGLNISYDKGDTWRFAGNIPVGQFYHVNFDMEEPYNVYGGMQDNGSWIGPSSIWQRGGILNSHWQELYFGDGFDVVPIDPRYGYAMSQGGNVGKYDVTTGRVEFVKPFHPEGEKLRFNWDAGIAKNPFNDCGVYFGSQYLHKSMDCGTSWDIISPDLTTNDTTKQKQGKSGGLTIDATNAENYTTITVIAPSPVDENVIWVGTDDGNLQITKDGGKTWTNVANRLTGLARNSWFQHIDISPKEAGTAYVVANNYRQNDWTPYAYRTTDYGQTWARLLDGNKVSGYALSMAHDPEQPNLIFAGTDHGLYFSIDAGRTWNKWYKDFPSCQTRDLKIHPREHDLVICTFGRALWVLDDIRPLREMAAAGASLTKKPLHLFDAPDATMANYKSYDAMHFPADAEYMGQNKRGGAMLTFYTPLKEKEGKKPAVSAPSTTRGKKNKKGNSSADKADGDKDEKAKKAGDKYTLMVIDMEGDTIRTMKRKLSKDGGLQRTYWSMSQKGVRAPSKSKPKPDADEPWGSSVLPGTYKVVMQLGDHKDSTEVTVKFDPRLKLDMAGLKAQQTMRKEYGVLLEKATAATDQLIDAQASIKLIEGQLKFTEGIEDSIKKDLKDQSKAMKDSISNLMDIYFGKESKGINSFDHYLRRDIWSANRMIGAGLGKPGQNALNAVNTAKRGLTDYITQINKFITEDWKAYQDAVKAMTFELFKETKAIDID